MSVPNVTETDLDQVINSGKLVLVDVDSNESLCARFGITNIPNMKFFKNGLEVANIVGAVPKNTLVAAINKNL